MKDDAPNSDYALGVSKRLFDVLVAIPMIVLAVPLVIAAGIAVKATSSGPAIFVQERMGRGKNVFLCYKLRTMATGTASVPTHEANNTAITPVGRVLRRTKIDELPQLWNVLRGDMSLVGPRPCLPNQLELIEERQVRGVFAGRPGITGLGQVSGVDMSTPAKLAQIDADYLANASFPGDLAILFKTVRPSQNAH